MHRETMPDCQGARTRSVNALLQQKGREWRVWALLANKVNRQVLQKGWRGQECHSSTLCRGILLEQRTSSINHQERNSQSVLGACADVLLLAQAAQGHSTGSDKGSRCCAGLDAVHYSFASTV
jgi:hypothetical protein